MPYPNQYPYQSVNPMQPVQQTPPGAYYYPTNPSYNSQNQFQQLQNPQAVPIGLNGRIINSISEVSAQDVPMGSRSIFPTQDGQYVYIKFWKPDGTIQTDVYVKEEREQTSYQSVEDSKWGEIYNTMNGFRNRLDVLNNEVDECKKALRAKAPTRSKKADDEDANS